MAQCWEVIGRLELSGRQCDSTAPIPYDDASQERSSSFCGSKRINTVSVVNMFLALSNAVCFIFIPISCRCFSLNSYRRYNTLDIRNEIAVVPQQTQKWFQHVDVFL